jgi:hypothetical protein
VLIAQVKVNPPDPPLAVVETESFWPWSAEHDTVHEDGEISTMLVSDGSWCSVTVNDRAPPAHGLGYLQPLLSVTFTATVQVSVADKEPTRHEYVDLGEPAADPEQYEEPVVTTQAKV